MKVEHLFERTRSSHPAGEIAALFKRLAFKHVYIPKWYQMSDEKNIMSFEEWREHKFQHDFGLDVKSTDPQRVSGITEELIELGIAAGEINKLEDKENQRNEMKKWLTPILHKLGWFLFRVGRYTFIDPIKQDVIAVPSKLYHFSLVWNKDSILRKGLLPKRGNYEDDFMYPPRVHVLTKRNEGPMRELAMHVLNHGRDIEDVYHNGLAHPPLAIFEIDTSKLNKGTKFYEDVSVDNGAWTYTHIPPTALKLIKEDEFHEDE